MLDFEDILDSTSSFSANSFNKIRGIVRDIPIQTSMNISMMWEVGRAMKEPKEVTKCLYDMSECYEAKMVPNIENVSLSESYKTGGQPLIIYGYGFTGINVSVTVDSLPCKVVYSDDEMINCTVPESLNVSDPNATYVGQHGLSRTKIAGAQPSYTYYAMLGGVDSLSMQFEAQVNEQDYFSNIF